MSQSPSSAIVECIPNFSEARRPEVVEAIIAADQVNPRRQPARPPFGSGPQPHRADLRRPACRSRRSRLPRDRQSRRADRPGPAHRRAPAHRRHRCGAFRADPGNISMPECVQMARRLGKRVGEELGIPVYLYEEAATRPERKNLENIRRGQYEALKEEMGVKPEREPDFGPAARRPGRRHGDRGAPAADRLQRLPDHRRCQHRQEDRQSRAQLVRRSALCQSPGLAGGRPRPGLDEPDQLPRHARRPGGGADPPRGRPLWRRHPPQRAGRADPAGSPGRGSPLVHRSSTSSIRNRSWNTAWRLPSSSPAPEPRKTSWTRWRKARPRPAAARLQLTPAQPARPWSPWSPA